MENITPDTSTDTVIPDSTQSDSLLQTQTPTETQVPATEAVVTETTPAVENESSYNDFINQIPEDIRDNSLFGKFKNSSDFFESMVELNKLASRKGDIPKPDAGDDEWSEFWGKAGRPEDANEYGIEIPEELKNSQRDMTPLLELAKQSNLTKTQANTLFKGLFESEIAQTTALNDARESQNAAEGKILQDAWGSGMEDMVEGVIAFQKSQGIFEAFESKGLNADGDLLVFMGKMAAQMKDDTVVQATAKTSYGVESQISELNEQLRGYISRGESVPAHLDAKLASLFAMQNK